MSNTDRNRQNILDLIEHITSGKLLDGFEKHYCETCVMSENGDPEQTRVGKAVNRQYETYFVENAEFHDVQLGPVIADGDTTAYEMTLEFTMGGNRIKRTQWAVQEWNQEGQITKETFFYGA